MSQTDQQSPKLKQFVEELNSLLEKYQYQLVPTLSVKNTGIVPELSIQDKIPPLTVNKPTPEAIPDPVEVLPEGKETPKKLKPRMFNNSKKIKI